MTEMPSMDESSLRDPLLWEPATFGSYGPPLLF
jgi:hypothetical protein